MEEQISNESRVILGLAIITLLIAIPVFIKLFLFFWDELTNYDYHNEK